MAKKRKADTVIPLRTGAKWLDGVRGEGLIIFDEGSRAALEASPLGELGAAVFHDPKGEKKLKGAEQVVVFTVMLPDHDGPFNAQWWVGPPPVAGEIDLTKRSHNPPQAGRLRVPTGRVRIESVGAISIGPEEPLDPEDVAELRIPKGHYDVSLYQAPIPNKNFDWVYFYLVFTPVPGAATAEPAKGNTRRGARPKKKVGRKK